jgi:NAD(P)-dependent dehydrogenase (short-subunit alcohol dehydrogenase family)
VRNPKLIGAAATRIPAEIRQANPHIALQINQRRGICPSCGARRKATAALLYGSSKAALRLLTQACTAEYGSSGVTANSTAPGPVRTPGTAVTGEALDQAGKTVPAGRVGTPAEVAAAAVFLASEGAGYVHGTTLAVDGGRVAL